MADETPNSDPQDTPEQPASAEADPGPIGTDFVMKGERPDGTAYRVPEAAAETEPQREPGDPGPIETEAVIAEEPGDPGPIGTVQVTEGERPSNDE